MLLVFDTWVGKLICAFMVININRLFKLFFRVPWRCLDIGNRIRLSLLETIVDLHKISGLLVNLWLWPRLIYVQFTIAISHFLSVEDSLSCFCFVLRHWRKTKSILTKLLFRSSNLAVRLCNRDHELTSFSSKVIFGLRILLISRKRTS
jgi:hypothetical protein